MIRITGRPRKRLGGIATTQTFAEYQIKVIQELSATHHLDYETARDTILKSWEIKMGELKRANRSENLEHSIPQQDLPKIAFGMALDNYFSSQGSYKRKK
jgi:hypothetical protein